MWKAVVTNDGKALLASWISGTTLNVTGAYGGTGIVAEAALMAQTALVDQRQTLSILSSEAVAGGRLFRIQITAPATGYTLEQIGIKGNVNAGSVKLIALFQEVNGGVSIPATADMPDFVFTFYGTVQMSNTGTINVTIDTSAVLSSSGDGSNIIAAFAQAATRENLNSGEKLSVMFGKIKKFFTDLGTAAFKNVGTTANDIAAGNAPAVAVSSHDADSSAHSVLFSAKLNMSLKGAPYGVAELDANGRVLSAQLPSYVDDVLDTYTRSGQIEYSSTWLSLTDGGTALIPENGKIYIVLSAGNYQNKTYRWSGSSYAEISSSLALGETSSTAYRGDRGKTAYDHSLLSSGNPHNVTKANVGLGNVDNTSDTAKPVSTAQQAALNNKVDLSASEAATLSAASWSGSSAPYSYIYSNANILSANTPVELLSGNGITATQLESLQGANIVGDDANQVAGQIKLLAFGDKPLIDIPVKFMFRRDM